MRLNPCSQYDAGPCVALNLTALVVNLLCELFYKLASINEHYNATEC